MTDSKSLPSKLWIAPIKDSNDNGSELSYLDRYFSQRTTKDDDTSDISRFYEGDNITVTLRGVWIKDSEDPLIKADGKNVEIHPFSRGTTNDLFIVSDHQFGTDPMVEKIHFMQNSTPLGYVSDFTNRRILAVKDFKDLDECLTLNLKIYDIDKVDSKFWDATKGLADNAIAAVPVLYQYAVPLKIASGVIDSVTKLAGDLDPHDKIIDERIDLEAANEATKHTLLQQGYYVIFQKEVTLEAARYLKLVGNQPKVLGPDGSEFKGCSYAVIEVQKEFRLSPQEEIDEKVSKLASELSGNGQSGKAAIEFLRDTMKNYNNFKKLERANELMIKGEDALSDSERKQLNDLKADDDIKEYLKT